MCEISIGTDTGGSVRVPAALCGLVGFKPSRQRVPTEGAFPLSRTLDSIGPIARSVADCAKADAIMAGEEFVPLEPIALVGLRFGVAEGLPLGGLDDIVSPAFAKAIGQLDDAGVRISRETLSSRDRLRRRAADVDPNVRVRIERGCGVAEADYADMLRERARLVGVMDTRVKDLDVLVMPTCAIVAPVLADIADAKAFAARNAAVLRNTSIINFFDLCAITLPLSAALPVGLMLVARNGHDRRLLRIAAAVTPLLGA
jgi:aspartyl-tRNA(Asn)/glutamyl-tRNA(Gln) amidotransferase subunit A